MKINSYYIAIIGLIILIPSGQVNCETLRSNNICYDFTRDKGHYILNASIFINSDIPTIVNLVYEFNNVKRFFRQAEAIEKLSESQDHFDMRLHYRYLGFRAYAVYRRILSPDNKRIYFRLISYKTNSELVPEVMSSEGYYEVKPVKSGVLLTLHHDTTLKSNSPVIGRLLVKKEDSFKYLEDIKKYAEKKNQ
jgi:hypothetical protein